MTNAIVTKRPGDSMDPESRSLDKLLHDGQPVWDAIDFDVRCARCDYELRLLPQPRCPECGLQFEWQRVLTSAATISDFLFEHNWRTRPVRSLATTVWRTFFPRRFWDSVSIHDRVCVGPLAALMLAAVAAFLLLIPGLAYVGSLLLRGLEALLMLNGQSPMQIGYSAATLEYISTVVISGFAFPLYVARFSVPLLTVLIGTIGILFALDDTMSRCNVRPAQLYRAVVYAFLPTCILMAACVVVSTALMPWIELFYSQFILGFSFDFLLSALALVVCWLTFATFLSVGLRRYLQLPRARLLSLTATGVGMLVMMIVMIALGDLL